MPTDALMVTTSEDNKDQPCVLCKASKQAAGVCRNRKGHSVLEYPGTSLTQQHCKILRDFRKGVFLIKDQMDLQRLMIDGGEKR